MCHDAPKDCDACHEKEDARRRPRCPTSYHPVIQPRAQGPVGQDLSRRARRRCRSASTATRTSTPSRRGASSSRTRTHLRAQLRVQGVPPRVRAHTSTASRSPTCCRATAATGSSTPSGGLVADARSARKCHPKGFELKPENHTKKFIKGTHKKRPSKDPAYCAMCHAVEVLRRLPHRQGQRARTRRPSPSFPHDHKDAKWRSRPRQALPAGRGLVRRRATTARRASGATRPSCRTRGTGSTNHKPRARRRRRATATSATATGSKCQNCHHGSVKNGELVAEELRPVPRRDEAEAGDRASRTRASPSTRSTSTSRRRRASRTSATSATSTSARQQAAQTARAAAGTRPAAVLRLPRRARPVQRADRAVPGASLCLRCHSDLRSLESASQLTGLQAPQQVLTSRAHDESGLRTV